MTLGSIEHQTRLSGHQWDKNADTISLKKKTVAADLDRYTKGKVLGLISQLWDPLGLMVPTTLQSPINLQDV